MYMNHINFKIFIVILILLLTQSVGATYPYYNYPADYGNYSGNGSGENYLQITQVEKALFNRTYEYNTIYDRLDRIEKKLFRTTRSQDSLAKRLETIMMNVNPSLLANVPLADLKSLEQKILNRTYTNEAVDMRLGRLEQRVFGVMQSGPADSRYQRLKSAASNACYNTGFYTAPYQTTTYPTGSKVRDVFNNVLGGLAGTITGITPPVYEPYDNYYNNSYDNPMVPFQGSHGQSQFYRNNNGYYNSFQDYGGGAGVRILN